MNPQDVLAWVGVVAVIVMFGITLTIIGIMFYEVFRG